MAFTPSPYQKEVFRCVRDEDGSLIIEAVAGSGKTTTIVGTVKMIPETKRVMFVAFNKSIAEELKTRLPDHVNCCTMNALGHRAWMRHINGRVNLNVKKTYDILDSAQITGVFGKSEVRSVRYVVNQLVGYAKSIGMVPKGLEDKLHGLQGDTDGAWHHIINHFNVDMNVKRDGKSQAKIKEETKERTKLAIEVARKVLEIGIGIHDEIDFNDQLYMTVIHDVKFPVHDFVFVDEAQDISHIQRVMLRKSLKKNGRLIAVGDPHQAIYGFRGADNLSLQNIGRDFNAKTLPLSISYRCPQNIVEEAQKFVPHIEANETAPEGTIEHLGSYSPERMSMFQPNDFVLCRNVAPLIKLAFACIAAGKPVGILGRDIGKSISKLIEKLKAKDLQDLRIQLSVWEKEEIERLQERDPEATGGYIKDRADAVRMFINCSGASSVSGVLDCIDELFNDDIEGAVKLSTIHKSKGLEAERVMILDRHLLPSRYATQAWQKEQENNLIYVAITRSMDYLGYVNSPDEEEN